MKKILALILCLVLSVSLLLCGCEKKTDDDEKEETTTRKNTSTGKVLKENDDDVDSSDATKGKTNEDPTKTTEAPTQATEAPRPEIPTGNNEFVNNSNNFYDADNLSIRPKHLYWEGDKLVAECFITNGKSTTAYNINVKRLAFGNEQVGIFAEGSFGTIDGLTVPAYGYTTWTFTFSGDAISTAGANLSSLNYESSVSFSH